MAMDPITAALNIGKTIIDKVVPDKAEANRQKTEMARMAMDGELNGLRIHMSAILAEAQSADPLTSRARPTFLYVIYILILTAIPMGVLSVFYPGAADQIADGFGAWLTAIPRELYVLFGAGYLGYSHYRSGDKKLVAKLTGDADADAKLFK